MNESNKDGFVQVSRSLADLLGNDYLASVCAARAFFNGENKQAALDGASRRVDFYPDAMRVFLESLLSRVGEEVMGVPLRNTAAGAASAKFTAATKTDAAPLSAYGYYRIGEDGRLRLITKSEHYHAPLGHAFPGYALVDQARGLGIPNATHNNTRGFITRRLEEELVRTANGLPKGDSAGLDEVLSRKDDLYTLNRVLNLETGSLAAEAALKLVLARFYRMQPEMPEPRYCGRTPVLLVMGNDDGGLQAIYHGTTVLTQMMRGMWPVAQAASMRPRCGRWFRSVPTASRIWTVLSQSTTTARSRSRVSFTRSS